MILIIGSEGCSNCIMTKRILDNKGIQYKYVLLNELPQEEQDKYLNMARKAKRISFPIIIKDEKVITIQEV